MTPYTHGLVGPMQMGEWMTWADLLFMVVWALLLAFLVVILVKVVLIPFLDDSDDQGEADVDQAMDVLRTRFARGEIDEAEFERRASVLATDSVQR